MSEKADFWFRLCHLVVYIVLTGYQIIKKGWLEPVLHFTLREDMFSLWKIALTLAVKDVCDFLHPTLRRMKHELQELRRRGAKSYARQYGEHTCARCQRPLGKFWNSGAVCRGCSHRICSRCRVGVGVRAADWKCTVCHAYRCRGALNHTLWLSAAEITASALNDCTSWFLKLTFWHLLCIKLRDPFWSTIVLLL